CRVNFDEVDDAHAIDAAGVCPPFAIFCDDFESGDVSKWSGVHAGINGIVVVADNARVHGGSWALHGNVPMQPVNGNEGDAYLLEPSPASGVLAIREWVRASASLQNYVGVLYLTDS